MTLKNREKNLTKKHFVFNDLIPYFRSLFKSEIIPSYRRHIRKHRWLLEISYFYFHTMEKKIDVTITYTTSNQNIRYRVTYFGDQKVRTFQSILQLREFQSILLYFTAYEEDRKIYFLSLQQLSKVKV